MALGDAVTVSRAKVLPFPADSAVSGMEAIPRALRRVRAAIERQQTWGSIAANSKALPLYSVLLAIDQICNQEAVEFAKSTKDSHNHL